jgi:hypothetical protein
VNLNLSGASGVIVGAFDVNVDYNPTVLAPTGCTADVGVCNANYDANTVRFGAFSITDLSGPIGSITFSAIGGGGTSSTLDVVVVNCANDSGDDISCTASDGLINVTTPTPSPTPTPTPTPIPTPTPTPTPSPTPPPLVWGDVDCNGTINAVDSLAIQRWKVGFAYNSAPGCPQIGVPMLPTLWGDVDCSGIVNAVDSLKIQRWKVALPVDQTQPCPVIGAPYP